jgi:quinoprotein glucose dehydrogenase
MIALNAKTGAPVATFGKAGVVDLKLEDDQVIDLVTGEVGLNATPLIAGDVVVVGAAHRAAGSPRLTQSVKGFVRGYDVKTGKRLWIFHTIPMEGEFGYDTWENGSAERNFNLGAWAQMSADVELGLVYVPLEMPAADYYGAHRPGNGLFDESLVALDLKTGKRKWHYQTVHHGLWDWDLPCAPILFNLTQNGRTVKALAQPTKSAFLFVLNRETGEPVWPIEERPVPQSNVPGEKTSPTQPFPTRPKPFDRQGVSEDDLIDLTPSMKADALEYIKTRKIGPIFTPPSLATPGGPVATLMLPADVGGANWPGGSFDPETNRLYIHSHTAVFNLNNVPADLSQAGPSAPEPGESPVPGARGGAAPGAAGPGAGAPTARGVGAGGGRGAGGFGGRGAGAPGGPGAAGPGGPGGAGAFGARAGGAGGGGRAGGAGPIQGMPLVKPPYDRITAYDMNTGDMLWQKAHSSSSDALRSNPALKGVDLKGFDINRLGATGRIFIGTLVTKTMVIAGDGGGVHTEPSGEKVAFLRAYDKTTGADLGSVSMPGHQTGGPMTYMVNGKQYITVSISDAAAGGSAFVTYALP